MNLPPSRELTTEKFDRLPPKLKVQSPKFKRNSRLQAPKSAGAFSLGKTGGHPTTTTEKREETDRGCARSASRSSSAGACVLGSFHRLWAFKRAAAGPSDTVAVRVRRRCQATQSLRATEEESNFACYLEDAPKQGRGPKVGLSFCRIMVW